MDVQNLKNILLEVNGLKTMRKHSAYTQLGVDEVHRILKLPAATDNAFVQSVCASALRGFLSEKQAYCLARFAVENGYVGLTADLLEQYEA